MMLIQQLYVILRVLSCLTSSHLTTFLATFHIYRTYAKAFEFLSRKEWSHVFRYSASALIAIIDYTGLICPCEKLILGTGHNKHQAFSRG